MIIIPNRLDIFSSQITKIEKIILIILKPIVNFYMYFLLNFNTLLQKIPTMT